MPFDRTPLWLAQINKVSHKRNLKTEWTHPRLFFGGSAVSYSNDWYPNHYPPVAYSPFAYYEPPLYPMHPSNAIYSSRECAPLGSSQGSDNLKQINGVLLFTLETPCDMTADE